MLPVNVISAQDLGAAFVKVTDGPRPTDVISIPTYLTIDPYLRLVEPPSNPLHGLHLQVLDSPCGIRGTFAFGQLAVDHGGRPVEGKVNKLTDEMIRYAQVVSLFVVAARAMERGIDMPALGIETLLPLLDYREVEQRRGFGAMFKGFYKGRFIGTSNPRWAALGEVMFRVERSLVGCEGAPVVALTPPPTPDAEWRAVADGGGSTLDVPVFRKTETGDWELHSQSSDGVEIHLNQAMEDLTRDVNRAYGRDYSRVDIAKILVEKQGSMPNGAAEPISILALAARHLEPVAEEVAAHLVNVWRRRPEIASFELIGGGMTVLLPFLKEAVSATLARRNHRGPVPFHLHLVPNPQIANALGAYAQAKRVFGNG